MSTTKQATGELGEKLVVKHCSCPKCKRDRTFKLLPTNFKCADVICDFCGYMAQIKTANVGNINNVPRSVPGASWSPQKARMDAGIYFPLYLVLLNKTDLRNIAIYYLPADLQQPEMFKERKPLSSSARRAGWQGFHYELEIVKNAVVRIV